jgi:hypothetical protein
LLKTSRDKTIFGVDRVVLPMRRSRFKPRLLESQFDLSPFSASSAPAHRALECSLDPKWLQTFDYLGADSAINAHPAEPNAPIAAMIYVTAATFRPAALGYGGRGPFWTHSNRGSRFHAD